MTDLEMTKLCAVAMAFQRVAINVLARPGIGANPPYVTCSYTGTSMDEHYDPLHNDEQAMALVKKIGLTVTSGYVHGVDWAVRVSTDGGRDEHFTFDPDLNRAIVLCVAKSLLSSKEKA